ncbi:MAG: hypothetical protein ACRERU_09895 [Methylococcales bacterium]
MKLYVWILVVLGFLVAVGAGFALSRHTLSSPDCRNRVISVKDKTGADMECVCVGGALASCFRRSP